MKTHRTDYAPEILVVLFVVVSVMFISACGNGETTVVRFADGTSIVCEIADSPKKMREGLTSQASLAAGRGMLFVYLAERPNVSFWMPQRMKFSIDMIFLSGDKKIIHIAKSVPPCESNIPSECPTYGPGGQGCQYVVEVVAGHGEKMGLKIGDQVSFNLP